MIGLQKIPSAVREAKNYYNFLFYFCMAIIQVQLTSLHLEYDLTDPRSIFGLLTIFASLGPLILLYTENLVYRQHVRKRILAHFIFPLLLLIMEVWFFSRPTADIVADLKALRHERYRHYLAVPFYCAATAITLYTAWRIRILAEITRQIQQLKIKAWVLSGISILILIVCAVLLIGFFADMPGLYLTGEFMVSFGIITLFLSSGYIPDFFVPITQAYRKRKLEKAVVGQQFDFRLLQARLESLMAEEKVYHDMDLNLNSLAQHMRLKVYKLSEFLNNHLGVSFYQYVNQWRLTEAAELLIANPRQDVISICFFVGFNSKSSFNTLFRTRYKLTPSEYRRKFAKEI